MNTDVHNALARATEDSSREQNIQDAITLLNDIRLHPTPDLAEIWDDLTDAQVDEQVQMIAHVHEWLNLS